MKNNIAPGPINGPSDVSALIKAYRESGLGLKRFAQEQGISAARLHYWIYQKHRVPKRKASAKDTGVIRGPVFQEVKLDPGSSFIQNWAAEVGLARGLNIRFSATAAPGWIGAVVQALQRPC
jgi:hypothetical protein